MLALTACGSGGSGAVSGSPAVSLSAQSVGFGSLLVGASATPVTLTLTNSGNAMLTLGGITISGANASSFSQTNTCGTSVAASGTCTISASFAPTSAGAQTASITITDNAAGTPQSIALAGTGIVPGATLSTSSLAFTANAGATPAPQAVTLSNPGTAPLTISQISVGGPNAASFSQTNTCGTVLAAGASCPIAVSFTSTATGSYAATLTVSDNASGSPQTVALAGTQTAPAVTFSPASLSFTTQVGSSSAAQTVTVTNTGNGTLTLGSLVLGGTSASSFSQTNTCGASVAAGATCVISILFTPSASGAASASITLADNATNSPQIVNLSGAGTAPLATLSPASLSFSANLGTAAAAQTVTLSNTGTAPLTISAIALAGTNAASFTQTNTCGSTVAVGANCTVSVSFSATSAGTYAASITLADNASGSPQSVALSATETAPVVSLSPSTLSFSTPVGSSSAAQAVTLTNTGNGTLTLGAPALTGANASSFADTTTCGASVAPGASCSFAVVFTPAASGALAASVALTDNAANSPQTIVLSGSGTLPVVTLSNSSLAFLTNLGSAGIPQTVTLTNTGPAPLNIASITLGGANASVFTQTNTCGATVAAGASCSLTLTFVPLTAGSDVASLTIADNAAASPQTIALTGTATAPVISLSSPALSFTTPAESTSASQTVTLSNTGNGTLNIASIALGGANAASFNQTSTCGSALAAGASCGITVSLTAYLAMSYSASVTIASNAPAGIKSLPLTGTGTGTISLNTANAADWVINNGAVTLDFDPAQFHIFGIHLAGDTNNLVDVTNISSKDAKPLGFYMGNQGLGTGTLYTGSKQVGNAYLDFWVGEQSNSTNFLTYEEHFIVTANDPGFHTYYVVHHSATDITGELSLVLWQFRTNLGLFTHSYEVNTGLGNLGVIDTPLPSPYNTALNDPGRQVQNAVVDLHGITDTATEDFIATSNRQFYTKYDFSTYEYLHKEHGVYGTQYGTWCVLPRTESIAGGPSKQDVDTLNQLIQQEMSGAHYVGTLNYVPPQGVDSTKLYGPVYFHFNQFTAANTTPSGLYQEAQTWLPWFDTLYDNDATLLSETYVPSTGRGTVAPTITNGGSATQYKAWTVLSDPATNFQWSGMGNNYWVNNNATGTAQITGVDPGTYRLSSYVLGEWGELRQENVVVAANQTTTVGPLTFTPENFGTAAPVWTIGTPDRSAHEFLHGHDASGNDFRNYQGAFNFWQDFAANNGLQVYYATPVGNIPATNDLNQINYVQWGTFDPGLYAGIYNAADDTTDGYNYIVPAYVGAANVATEKAPGLNIHFTTSAAQTAQGQYAVLSAGLAGVEGSFVATLNGHQLIWHVINESDPMVRSGLSGYYQWVAFEWPTSYLSAPGADNVLTIGVSQIGVMMDALRFEITNKSSDPVVTGWHDYEYVSGSKYTPANDAVPNN